MKKYKCTNIEIPTQNYKSGRSSNCAKTNKDISKTTTTDYPRYTYIHTYIHTDIHIYIYTYTYTYI